MRARGDSATEILTAESMADKYGVQKGSYESLQLPADAVVQQVWSMQHTCLFGLAETPCWHASTFSGPDRVAV